MQLLFLLIPLICIFILNLPKREMGGRIAPWVIGAVCVLQAAMAATSATGATGGLSFWQPMNDALKLALPVPITLHTDYISATVLFTIALVAAAANAVGLSGDTRKRLNLGSLTLILMAGMNGAVMVRDMFSLYIFLEITAVSSYILIAMEKNFESLEGAFKYMVLSGLGTAAMLAANALVFMSTGSLTFANVAAELSSGSATMLLALTLYAVGFGVKAGVVPFHGWLPGVYYSAPDSVSVLLAGIVTKVAGVYMIIRLMSIGVAALSTVFMALGALSIVVGAFAAIGQKGMKRMLAYSSISQVGYIILAAGLGTPLAIAGALLHFFNHAVFKSLLFVDAAAVKEQTGTTVIEPLGGLSEKMKVTGWTSVIGFLSTAGIPPLAGFWSKLLIIMALGAAGQWFYAALALLTSLVTLGYFLIMQRKVFFGKIREGFEQLREARGSLRNTALILAIVTTVLGVIFPAALVILYNNGLI